jgi:hypothetical protein
MSSPLFTTLTLIALALLLGGCPPPPPPVISDFTVVPTNQCATVPVAVRWGADAASGQLAISPATSETPPNPLPSLSGGGFRFRTASTDTTYTLTVERGGLTATQSRTVRIVPNPFVMTLEFPYNCDAHVWELPAFSDLEYGEVITVRSFTNLESQPLLLEFGAQATELPPGVPTPLLLPVRFAGTSLRWTVRLPNGAGPICRGGGATVQSPDAIPPPVHITVTCDCPTR